jgi:hypothetical protein
VPIANCCPHSACVQGGALNVAACSYTNATCVSTLCALDPFCCSTSWDSICAGETKNATYCPTGVAAPNNVYSCACAHSYCVTGVALSATCDPCVKAICAADSFCCTTSFDSICQNEVNSICHIPLGADCK